MTQASEDQTGSGDAPAAPPTGVTEASETGTGTDTLATGTEASAAPASGHTTTIRVAVPVASEPGYEGRRFSVFTVHGAVVHEVETHDVQIGVALSPGKYHVYVNNVASADEERFGKPVNKEITITGEGVEDFLIE
jgi:hypothetical protein